MRPRDGRIRNHPLLLSTPPKAAPVKVRGFTLVEAAVMLVITGLLVQAVIYGQSLIDSARVQALAAQQGAVTGAMLAFQDRFRALPGDFGNTEGSIDCDGSPCAGGNDNGLVESDAHNEDIIAWTHLSASGFLAEQFRIESPTTAIPSPANTPSNVFGGYLHIASDVLWGTSTNPARRLNAKAGNQVPVEVLAEVDRRIDDGRPTAGRFQFSAYSAGYDQPPITGEGRCISVDTAEASWYVPGGQANCGAASLLN
jgi:hypothetical protein